MRTGGNFYFKRAGWIIFLTAFSLSSTDTYAGPVSLLGNSGNSGLLGCANYFVVAARGANSPLRLDSLADACAKWGGLQGLPSDPLLRILQTMEKGGLDKVAHHLRVSEEDLRAFIYAAQWFPDDGGLWLLNTKGKEVKAQLVLARYLHGIERNESIPQILTALENIFQADRKTVERYLLEDVWNYSASEKEERTSDPILALYARGVGLTTHVVKHHLKYFKPQPEVVFAIQEALPDTDILGYFARGDWRKKISGESNNGPDFSQLAYSPDSLPNHPNLSKYVPHFAYERLSPESNVERVRADAIFEASIGSTDAPTMKQLLGSVLGRTTLHAIVTEVRQRLKKPERNPRKPLETEDQFVNRQISLLLDEAGHKVMRELPLSESFRAKLAKTGAEVDLERLVRELITDQSTEKLIYVRKRVPATLIIETYQKHLSAFGFENFTKGIWELGKTQEIEQSALRATAKDLGCDERLLGEYLSGNSWEKQLAGESPVLPVRFVHELNRPERMWTFLKKQGSYSQLKMNEPTAGKRAPVEFSKGLYLATRNDERYQSWRRKFNSTFGNNSIGNTEQVEMERELAQSYPVEVPKLVPPASKVATVPQPIPPSSIIPANIVPDREPAQSSITPPSTNTKNLSNAPSEPSHLSAVNTESTKPTEPEKSPQPAKKATSSSPALVALANMPGLENVATDLGEIEDYLKIQKRRLERGMGANEPPALHLLLTGNPGVGKTVTARAYGQMLIELGFLGNGKGKADGTSEMPVVEVGIAELKGAAIGKSTENIEKKIQEAIGGVLLIDEIHHLNPKQDPKDPYLEELIRVLLKKMEDHRHELVVVGTGYAKQIDEFLDSDDGFRRRFPKTIHLEDYDDPTLEKIMVKMLNDRHFDANEATQRNVVRAIGRQRGGRGFGNAGTIRNVLEAAIRKHSARLSRAEDSPTDLELKTLIEVDFEILKQMEGDPLAQLDELVGLDSLKTSLRSLLALLKIEKEKIDSGMTTLRPNLNSVFEGNPGTGKTSVAEVYGKVLKQMGFLSNGEVVVVKATDLLGKYENESKEKTRNALNRARGKVLVIDEAYVFANGSSRQGQDVIDTIVAEVQPDQDTDRAIILTGYRDKMNAIFNMNAGMTRRFPRRFTFDDYSNDQLADIMRKKARGLGLNFSEEAVRAAAKHLGTQRKAKDFGNAGAALNLLKDAMERQAVRLANDGKTVHSQAELAELKAEDLIVPRPTTQQVFAGIEQMTGLEPVKEELREIMRVLTLTESRGGDPGEVFEPYFVFEGRNGVGKESVTHELAKLLYSANVLPSAEVKVLTADDLMAEYTGQTGPKVRTALEDARGKTILLKGVGPLAGRGNPFLREGLETLAQFMESNRGNFALVLSGDHNEMQVLKTACPKLASQINRVIQFTDTSVEDAKGIFVGKLTSKGLKLTPEAERLLTNQMERLRNSPNWASGDDVDNFVRKTVAKRTIRIVDQTDSSEGAQDLPVEASDVEQALDSLLGSKGVGQARPINLSEPSNSFPVDSKTTEREKMPQPSQTAKTQTKPVLQMIGKEEKLNVPDENHTGHRHRPPKLSAASTTLTTAIESLIKKGEISAQAARQVISSPKPSPETISAIQRELNSSGTTMEVAQISKLLVGVSKEINSIKDELEKREETADSNQAQGKKLVQRYVCLACGRTNCNVMPFWWTEELPE